MTFKITVARAPLTLEFEVGSVGEGIAILSDNAEKLTDLLGLSLTLNGDESGESAAPSQAGDSAPPKKERKKRGQDVATATAPAPIAPPVAAAAPAPASAMPDIPASLDRRTAAAPPPPIMPNAPPVAPAAPPPAVGTLAPKIIAELNRRAVSDENKKQLVDWLATSGFVQKAATFDEAISVVQFTTDEKLSSLMAPLGLS